jgi:hypothetical protein
LSGDILTWDIIAQTWTDTTEKAALPAMTSEEAAKKIQEMLSGTTTK